MEISPRVLRGALSENLGAIETQIQAVGALAESMRTLPSQVRDSQGNFLLTPLLVAQAQILHALTLLQTGGKDAER